MPLTRVNAPAGSLDSTAGTVVPRNVPIDFFVTTTAAYDATNGYAWSELRGVRGAGFSAPTLPLTGDQAWEVSGRTDVPSGSICRLFLDRDQTTYGLVVISESGGTASCTGTSWVAALRSTDCLEVSVLSSEGACAGAGTDSAVMTSSDGQTWGGASGVGDPISTACCPADPIPQSLTVTVSDGTVYTLDWIGPGGGTDYWQDSASGYLLEMWCSPSSTSFQMFFQGSTRPAGEGANFTTTGQTCGPLSVTFTNLTSGKTYTVTG